MNKCGDYVKVNEKDFLILGTIKDPFDKVIAYCAFSKDLGKVILEAKDYPECKIIPKFSDEKLRGDEIFNEKEGTGSLYEILLKLTLIPEEMQDRYVVPVVLCTNIINEERDVSNHKWIMENIDKYDIVC